MKAKRQAIKEQQRRKRSITLLSWGGLALAAIAIIVYASISAARSLPEESIAVMPDTSHVAEGTDPGPYNSNPPTSGKHYEKPLQAGFYNPGDVQAQYPAGHLVHSLEHGYIIFWYNCSLLVDEAACTDLKSQIKQVMDGENNNKVIAYPWESTDVPVVMTSWGKLLRLEDFSPSVARDFVRRNRNKAPEPQAP